MGFRAAKPCKSRLCTAAGQQNYAQVLAGMGVNPVWREVQKVIAAEKCHLPDPDSFPALLLTMIALSGEIPIALTRRLSGSSSYADFAVKRLKGDGLIRTYYRNGLRGLRLTAQAKKLLAAKQPDRFLPLFTGSTMTSTPKYTIVHRLRLHRMAETLVTMLNAGVSVYPWKKPEVFSPANLAAEPDIERPTYYSARELKNLGLMTNRIRGSRCAGILLANGDIFVAYSTGTSEMQWEYKAEMRLRSLLQIELCQQRLPAQFMNARQHGVLFAADMTLLPAMAGVESDKRQSYFLTGESFKHFHYLTCDHHGDVVLRLLCDPDKRAVLDGILSEDLDPARPDFIVENDAMENGSPALFAYTCDVPRIKSFDGGLALHGLTGTLYCFDFQEDALRQMCAADIEFRCIGFDEYERGYFHPT